MSNNHLVIFDWKTSTYVSAEMSLQLGAYALANLHQAEGQWLPTPPQLRPTGAQIIHLGKDVRSLVRLSQAELEAAASKFLLLVDVFEWMVAKGYANVPENEAYRWNGTFLPSVTYILRHVIAKPNLLNWYAKMAKEGKDPNQIRDEKAAWGTKLHKLILAYLQGREIDLTQAPPELVDTVVSFQRWSQRVKLKPVWLETKVARVVEHPQGREDSLSYGGTLDCLAWCELEEAT